MKIAFTSTSGQGKTTLMNILKEKLPDYKTFNSVQRTLAKHIPNFTTSEKTTDFTQTCILGAMAYNLITYPNFISDRSLICNFAYSSVSKNVKNSDFLEQQFQNLVKLYDIIFYIPYEIKVQNDNFRSVDDLFHKQIDEKIQMYIKKFKHVTNIVTISGTVEQRTNKIIEELKRLNIESI